jgi:hypothetical protein
MTSPKSMPLLDLRQLLVLGMLDGLHDAIRRRRDVADADRDQLRLLVGNLCNVAVALEDQAAGRGGDGREADMDEARLLLDDLLDRLRLGGPDLCDCELTPKRIRKPRET